MKHTYLKLTVMWANPILASMLGLGLFWLYGWNAKCLLYWVSVPLMIGLVAWWCHDCLRYSFRD